MDPPDHGAHHPASFAEFFPSLAIAADKMRTTKRRRPRSKGCKGIIKIKSKGRVPTYCSQTCRQNAYLKRRYTGPMELLAQDIATVRVFFFADLRAAWELYQRSEGHGRAGAIKAISAAWRLIALFEKPFSENLHLPILRLHDALTALDDNNVSSMLQPVPRTGRADSIGARTALKGYVAGTVMRLLEARVSRREAHREVAKVLLQRGVRPERGPGQVTSDTVRHWCDEVAADVGRKDNAAMVCDGMFTPEERTKFARLPSDQKKQQFALASLADFVAAVFPEMRSR